MSTSNLPESGARPFVTLAACIIVTGLLGSIHAFSVFIVPLEATYTADRSDVSLVYSLALLSLTVLVLFGHRIYSLLEPAKLAALACMAAAGGLALAAGLDSLTGAYVGYGLLFGAANGVGYGFVLQLAAQALPNVRGFAMGAVTAAYAVGATIFAKLFSFLLLEGTPAQTMLVMAGVLVVASLVVFVLLTLSKARYVGGNDELSDTSAPVFDRMILRLWIGYGFGAAAGLMAIGHATGIVSDNGGSTELTVLGAMLISVGNAIGGTLAGYMADRINARRLLLALPLLSALALSLLLTTSEPQVAIAILTVIGFSYGAIIVVYPAAVTTLFGANQAARVYGIVFTAWGLAGLGAPWLAGYLYDSSGTYQSALGIAILTGLVSFGAALGLPSSPRQ
ncbi:MAG: MFS transporter [Ardenticatenaceae bacterium]